MIDSCQGQFFLAVEMVEETALRQAGSFAYILNARRGISLGTYHLQGGVEQLSLRLMSYFRRSACTFTHDVNRTD